MKDKEVLLVSYIGWTLAFLSLCVGVFIDIRTGDWATAACNVVWMGIIVMSVFSTKEYKNTLDEKNKYRQDAFDLASEKYKLRGEVANLKQNLEETENLLRQEKALTSRLADEINNLIQYKQ